MGNISDGLTNLVLVRRKILEIFTPVTFLNSIVHLHTFNSPHNRLRVLRTFANILAVSQVSHDITVRVNDRTTI